MSINDLKTNKNIFYFAHRGAPWVQEENTIGSFVEAINLGCEGIEMDVQLTKDNHIIIFHDYHIIFKKSYHKIKDLNHSTIKYMMRKMQKPEPPVFDLVIPLITQHPNTIFNIEIKSRAINNHIIIKHIKNKLTTHKINEQCIVSSFNYLLLLQTKFLFKESSIALIMGEKRLIKKKIWIYKLLIKILRPQFLHINWQFLSKQFLGWLRNQNMGANVYTVNNKAAEKKMVDMGISVFFTDNHRFYSKSISRD